MKRKYLFLTLWSGLALLLLSCQPGLDIDKNLPLVEKVQFVLDIGSEKEKMTSSEFKSFCDVLKEVFPEKKGFFVDKHWRFSQMDSYDDSLSHFVFYASLYEDDKSSFFNKTPICVVYIIFNKGDESRYMNLDDKVYKHYKSHIWDNGGADKSQAIYEICINNITLKSRLSGLQVPSVPRTYFSQGAALHKKIIQGFKLDVLEQVKQPK